MKIFSGKWSFLVLAELIQGKRRFNELRRNLGNVNTKGLTDTLRHLEESGMISRKVFPTVPVTVEYKLTEKGKEFHSIFKEMAAWGGNGFRNGAFLFCLRFAVPNISAFWYSDNVFKFATKGDRI
nr:helix-turn-helix domain-containing protein [Bacillus licheniformis]